MSWRQRPNTQTHLSIQRLQNYCLPYLAKIWLWTLTPATTSIPTETCSRLPSTYNIIKVEQLCIQNVCFQMYAFLSIGKYSCQRRHKLVIRCVSHLVPWECLGSVSVPWFTYVVDFSIVHRFVYTPDSSLSYTYPVKGEGSKHLLPPAFWNWRLHFLR